MIILDSTDVLRARLAAAPAATQPSFAFAWGDQGATPGIGQSRGVLAGTTNVTMVAAPATNYVRLLRSGIINNRDTADITVTLETFNGTTAVELMRIAVPFGQALFMNEANGWQLGVIAAQGNNGADGLPGNVLPINNQSGTSYTFVLTDVGTDVRFTNAAAVTATIPPNSSVAFPVGALIAGSQVGAGAVTFAAGAGVTLRAPFGAATTAQYDQRVVEKVATDEWIVR